MSNPIRILHVLGGLDAGGTETMLMNLYRNIDKEKVQFDFLIHTERNCTYSDEVLSLGGKIFSISKYRGINHISYKREWKSFFKEHSEYNVIHGHMRSTASIYLNIAKKFGRCTIAHSHSTSSGRGISALVKRILQYKIKHIADYFFACSHQAGEWLFGKKIVQSEKFKILNNAITPKNFTFDENIRNIKRKELKLGDCFTIGHIGRFEKPKNHKFLIDVFFEVIKRRENAKLLLVGDGTLKNSIIKKVKRLGIENKVIFAGIRTDINHILQAMDVLLFPSTYEGLGIAVIEAQASSLPCVVSNNIPKEAFITDIIFSISLKSNIKEWTNKVLTCKRDEIINEYDITNEGYNIDEIVIWLTKFYERMNDFGE